MKKWAASVFSVVQQRPSERERGRGGNRLKSNQGTAQRLGALCRGSHFLTWKIKGWWLMWYGRGSHFLHSGNRLSLQRYQQKPVWIIPRCPPVFISWSISVPDHHLHLNRDMSGMNGGGFYKYCSGVMLCLFTVDADIKQPLLRTGVHAAAFYELHRLCLWLRMCKTINFYSTGIMAGCFHQYDISPKGTGE